MQALFLCLQNPQVEDAIFFPFGLMLRYAKCLNKIQQAIHITHPISTNSGFRAVLLLGLRHGCFSSSFESE
jgi:hypothetical protein